MTYNRQIRLPGLPMFSFITLVNNFAFVNSNVAMTFLMSLFAT